MTKIERAIQYAAYAHAGTTRKGKDRPYIMHPIEVLAIVGALTEDADVLAAAVLHDVVEDTDIRPETIRREFGKKVERLVMAESEDKMKALPAAASWKDRKQATIDHLATLERNAKLICLGDKLANIREMSRDYAKIGDKLWERFNQKDKSMHGWYYREICDVLEAEFGEIPEIREYRALLRAVFGEQGEEIMRKPIKLLGVDEMKRDTVIFYFDRGDDLNAYIWVREDLPTEITDIYGMERYCRQSVSGIYVGKDMPYPLIDWAYKKLTEMPEEEVKRLLAKFDARDEELKEHKEDYKERQEFENGCLADVKKMRNEVDAVYYFM